MPLQTTCSIMMAQTFTLFPQLPPELRLKIWNDALHFFPRIIEVTPQHLNPDAAVQYKKWNAMASTIPTLLQVNREARYELLPQYPAPFACPTLGPYSSASLLLNYKLDTVYFRIDLMTEVSRERFFEHIFGDAESEVRSNLKSLAGNDRFWRIMIPTNNDHRRAGFREFDNFSKLQDVNVVGYLEQRLDDSNKLPRLERFEECDPRDVYEAAYPPWFNEGFNSTQRSIPISIKLCREVAKQ
jgi:hypothetical protein